jgi:uncharacterized protein YndB with AHSA1/START domain
MTALPYSLERSVVIRARRETVFSFFTDSARFAAWWGTGSAIEPRPGGAVSIRYPNGVMVTGEVVDIVPQQRISFTYGYVDNPQLVPPGGSLVTISLENHPEGTRLHLQHELPDEPALEAHRQGWAYQLALFANAVANEEHRGAPALIDRYFAIWSDPDGARRQAELRAIGAADLAFRDGFGATASPEELAQHIGAVQKFMPGLDLHRNGEVRHCQGTAIAEWEARAPDGALKARGTNVFDLSAEGHLMRVVGFWAPQ